MILQATNDEKIRGLDGVLLSIGIACALVIGALTYAFKNGALWTPVNDSTYLTLRGAYRVVDFLHLQSTSPVATSVLRRQPAFGSQRLGIEIAVLVTVLGVASAVWLLLSLVSYARNLDAIVRRLTLAILLFAPPACYFTVSWLTWPWPQANLQPSTRGSFFRENLLFTVFIGEIVCVCTVLLLRYWQRKVTSRWAVALFGACHFAFWIFVLWQDTRFWLFPIYSVDFVLLLILTLPFVHMFQPRERFDRIREHRATVWSVGAAIALLVPFAAIWAPARAVQLSHPRNLDLLKVELAWGPCFGSCPQYKITVQGDGRVEFLGRHGHSRFETRKQGSIEREKVMQILQELDQVKFTALEDRAFSWAFDTPSVGVSVWEDGKTKEVVSDASAVGYKDGRQARFVQAAREIDRILESTQWSYCEGEECVPISQERAQQPHRIHVSEDVQKAKLVRVVSPVYPPVLGKRMDGTVVLHVIIATNGSVQSARPVSGLPNLRESAVNAVLQWRYKPTLVNGVAVEVDTTVSVVFPPLAKQEAPTEHK